MIRMSRFVLHARSVHQIIEVVAETTAPASTYVELLEAFEDAAEVWGGVKRCEEVWGAPVRDQARSVA